MNVDIITLFPEFFDGPLSCGTLRIARQAGALEIKLTNPRDFTADGKVDDYQFGGGAGMVMKAEPLIKAVSRLRRRGSTIINFTPKGTPLDQALVRDLSSRDHLILVCGRYKGIDERFNARFDPLLVSVGDYVLAGGEIASLVLVEAAVRLLPGVLGNTDSAQSDSLESGLLEAPIYTRPATFRKQEVPEVLRGGDHRAVAEWRRRLALAETLRRRPDLLPRTRFTKNDLALLLEVLDGN
jgi:tRNA (guanine37-N1)-methyltransferase